MFHIFCNKLYKLKLTYSLLVLAILLYPYGSSVFLLSIWLGLFILTVKNQKLFSSYIVKLIVLFQILIFASFLWVPTFEVSQILKSLCGVLPVYVFQIFNTKEINKKVFIKGVGYSFIISGAIFSVIFSLKNLAFISESFSSIFDPNYASTFFLFCFLLSVSFNIKNKNYVLVICMLLNLTGLILTYSRGALFAGFLILLFLLYKSNMKFFKKVLFFFIMVLIMVFCFIYKIKYIPDYSDIFKRIENYKKIVILLIKNPYGYGSGSFPECAAFFMGERLFHPHNIFLFVFFEYGVVAFVIFCYIVIKSIRTGLKYTTLRKYILPAYLGILFHNLVDCSYYNFKLALLFYLCIGIFSIYENMKLDLIEEAKSRYGGAIEKTGNYKRIII